jgi:hypothetical protein
MEETPLNSRFLFLVSLFTFEFSDAVIPESVSVFNGHSVRDFVARLKREIKGTLLLRKEEKIKKKVVSSLSADSPFIDRDSLVSNSFQELLVSSQRREYHPNLSVSHTTTTFMSCVCKRRMKKKEQMFRRQEKRREKRRKKHESERDESSSLWRSKDIHERRESSSSCL